MLAPLVIDQNILSSLGLSIGSALALGAMAQVHCGLMCGPLVSAFTGARKTGLWFHQLGRTLSYSLVGFVAAAVGSAFRPNTFLSYLFLALSLGLIVYSLRSYFGMGRSSASSPQTTGLFHRTFDLLLSKISHAYRTRSFVTGLATPLLPCGQFWGVIGFAAMLASPLHGALLAGSFAIFTAPGVLGFLHVRQWLTRFAANRSARALAIRTVSTGLLLALMLFSSVRFIAVSAKSQPTSSTPVGAEAAPICH